MTCGHGEQQLLPVSDVSYILTLTACEIGAKLTHRLIHEPLTKHKGGFILPERNITSAHLSGKVNTYCIEQEYQAGFVKYNAVL